MNVTLSLDDDLVKHARRIANERDTTITALIREYLEQLANEDVTVGRKRRERDALIRSFAELQTNVGARTWSRQDLHERR